MWTNKQHFGYISICAHFIDDNKISQKRLVPCKMLEYPHSGLNMATIFFDVLRCLNIYKKILNKYLIML